MTTIINLFGGSGVGKSATASYLFYKFKANRYSIELVREYIKSWAWENRTPTELDQFYIFGKQSRKEAILLGKVDYIVTDSPVYLLKLYSKKYCSDGIHKAVSNSVDTYLDYLHEKGHSIKNILINRTKPYDPTGRYQTEEEALQLDIELLDFLQHIKYTSSGIEENDYEILYNNIISKEV